jgi:RNA polymerase sigma factor for flagellar operon FliA
MDPRALFLDSLSSIESIIASMCRRYSVWGDDADDIASWIKERLMDDDYAVLRKYRGESEPNTFLTVVITRLFHAHRRERMGRWRHSAAAERLGPEARELEALVHRDGWRLHEAGERMRQAGRTTRSDAELARILALLPDRGPLRPVDAGADPLETAPGGAPADGRVALTEAERHRQGVMAALFRAMRALQPEEQMIVRMNLADGRSVADVARALKLDQRGLYRRIDRLRARLRQTLESEGVSRGDVYQLLEEQGPEAEAGVFGPSNQ